jgi:hypothetical protein
VNKRRPQYFSQWGDVACNEQVVLFGADPAELHDWRADGYCDAESYRLWSRNTCGIACLQSLLSLSQEQATPARKADLIYSAVHWGALVPRPDGSIKGLIYAPFVEWIGSDYQLEAYSHPALSIDNLVQLLATGEWLVMASVSSEIRWPATPPTRQGGHLVLAFDLDQDVITFHNPSGLSGSADSAKCTLSQFQNFYAGRGIAIKKS